MPTLIQKRCQIIMEYLREQGYTEQVSLGIIQNAINLKIGSNKATIKQYTQSLVEFGFLEIKGINLFGVVKGGPSFQ